MKFRIARSREGGNVTHYDVFEVEAKKGQTILDILFHIQDHLDPSLSFRYSCRGAVCGSCALLINTIPMLACRSQVESLPTSEIKLKPFAALTDTTSGWNKDNEILIEPLPNFPVLKDLVVDMTKFFDALESMKLWGDAPEGSEIRLQNPEEQSKIDRYVNCILCALCYGSCPVNAATDDYLGPAALTKAWRFSEDSRSSDPDRYLQAAKQRNGVPMCDLVMNCIRVCPKGVAPGGAIRKMK
ncbi:MAG: succinate dehydrogenase/fumarate reductase iron-sulfur subunit [Candidatus Thorarchaeota archaeon]